MPSQNICFCWLYCYSLVSTEAALQIFSLWKGVLKLCSKFTRKRPCRSVISIKLQSNFIEIALWHRCSPVNLLHIFRTPFHRNIIFSYLNTISIWNKFWSLRIIFNLNYLYLNVWEQKIVCQLYATIQGKKSGCLCISPNHPRKTIYEKYESLLLYL